MKPAWTVSCYVRSRLEEPAPLLPMMELTFVVWGNTPPTKDQIFQWVMKHTNNCTFYASEAAFTPIPEEVYPF